MSDLSLVKASIEALAAGVSDLAVVIEKKQPVLESTALLVEALLVNEAFKSNISFIRAAGISALIAQVKTMNDLAADTDLAVSVIPAIQKVVAAFKASPAVAVAPANAV